MLDVCIVNCKVMPQYIYIYNAIFDHCCANSEGTEYKVENGCLIFVLAP